MEISRINDKTRKIIEIDIKKTLRQLARYVDAGTTGKPIIQSLQAWTKRRDGIRVT
jgi:hypothetical protein